MAKLTEYPAVTRFDTDDILIKDGTGGTKKIKAKDAAIEFAGMISAENHRMVYRGKNLGGSVTAAQKTAIQNGSFDDLFLGDYWAIGGVNYRIADFDYWYNTGDNPAFTKHHLVIVPDSALYSAQMNEENVTTGGYLGSKMYTENLKQAKTTITNAFGAMVQSHRVYLDNAVTDGHVSARAWVDSTVDLMNENMVYGSHIWTPMRGGIETNLSTVDKTQLALFAVSPKMINRRYTYWLRDVVSATYFALVVNVGAASSGSASNSNGVRPAFAIG